MEVREAVRVPKESLQPHPRNYKTHPPDQLEHIKNSIKQNGIYRNVVVARGDVILAGHGVWQAVMALDEITDIPIVRLDIDPYDPRALKLIAADNEVGKMAYVDDRALSNLLKEVVEAGEDLLGTGLDAMALANLVFVTRGEEEIRSFDAATEWVGMPEFDSGGEACMIKVQFMTLEDRERFVREKRIHITRAVQGAHASVWSAWWPRQDRNNLGDLVWEEGERPVREGKTAHRRERDGEAS